MLTVDLKREGRSAADGCRRARSPGSKRRGSRGEQALLFLNRRGYAPLTLCRACGHRFEFPIAPHGWSSTASARRSSAIIAATSRPGRSSARTATRPTRSPPAGRASSAWPRRRRFSFPTSGPWSCRRTFPAGSRPCAPQLDAAARGAYDLIIGTQLVAKGHNFPLLTFVCVVDADVGLANADPRAAERTFQLLRQATGRAGRGEKLGRALLQTWQPDHPVIAALISGDAERFYAQETEERRRGGLPPFGAWRRSSSRPRTAARPRPTLGLWRAPPMASGRERWRVAPLGGQARENEIVLLGPAERRSPSCVSATGSAWPPRRLGRPTCRVSCARCSPPRPRRAAG